MSLNQTFQHFIHVDVKNLTVFCIAYPFIQPSIWQQLCKTWSTHDLKVDQQISRLFNNGWMAHKIQLRLWI